MKKQYPLILILIFIFSTNLDAQKNKILPDGITKEEVKEELNKVLLEFDKINQMNELINLRFIVGSDSNDDNEKGKDNDDIVEIQEAIDVSSSSKRKWEDLTDAEIRQKLIAYFSKLKFTQDYDDYPKTSFIISSSDLIYLNNDYQPEYKIKKIYCADGSSIDIKNIQNIDDFKMNKAKPIDSIRVEVKYKYPSKQKDIILSADNPNYEDGTTFAYLTSLKGRDAEITISGDLYNNNPEIKGLNKNGEFINYSSSFKTKLPSEEVIKVLLEQKKSIESIVNEIDKYGSVEELDTELYKILRVENQIDQENESVNYHSSFFFKRNVFGLKITYSQALDSIQENIVVKNKKLTRLYTVLPIEIDNETEKVKSIIIDKSGKIIIPSILGRFEYVKGLYFNHIDEDYKSSLYRLDTQKQKLVRCPFDLGSIYECSKTSELINIQDKDKNVGVADMDGNIIIPMKYYSIYDCQNKDYIITLGKDNQQTKGLFKKNGEQVLPEEYRSIKIRGNYIYASENRSGRYITHIYTRDKEEITKNNWSAKSEFEDNTSLALVEDANRTKFYINIKGDIVIPPSNDYLYSSGFDGGLCAVKDAKSFKWGYMDLNGKIIIPCKYTKALSFMGEYAYVEDSGEAMLIDVKNNVYKRLPDILDSYGYNYNEDYKKTTYKLKNRMTINYKGENTDD